MTDTITICRWDTGAAIYSVPAPPKLADASLGERLGYATLAAIKNGTSLDHASLDGANLVGASLNEANLDHPSLKGANLYGANLNGARLNYANLNEANLYGANLNGARLNYANLNEANLDGANLYGANLNEANLDGANLNEANLDGANLYGANLKDARLDYARLDGANLNYARLDGARLDGVIVDTFRADVLSAIALVPDELEALLAAINEGRIDGSTYSGDCACLAGTIAKARGIPEFSGDDFPVQSGMFVCDPRSPREQWFGLIRPGQTPENHAPSRIARDWVMEAIDARDAGSATAS